MSDTITLSLDYFEHLLNCLANQKFLHEMNTEDLKSVQAENQRIIDVAWNTGMSLLSTQRHKDGEGKR